MKKWNIKYTVAAIVAVVGFVLFVVGLSLKIPSDQLTSYSYLANDGEYSYVEEYINGDAYNYIIAASLIGTKISGIMTQKAVFISVGLLILCISAIFGIASYIKDFPKESVDNKNE